MLSILCHAARFRAGAYAADLLPFYHKMEDYSLELEDAVERAITECIKNDILADFLRKYRAEAKSVSIYEYNEERHM